MTDKELLDMLGLNDRTIKFGLDEDIQIAIEHKIDDYLKKIDEEKKKKEDIDFLKKTYEEHKEKEKFLSMFNDSYVFKNIKNKLIREKFVNDCKFCWGIDVSGQYAKATKPKTTKKR